MTHETEIKWLQDRLELSEQSSLSMVRLVACKTVEMSGLQAEIERLQEAIVRISLLGDRKSKMLAAAALQPKEGEG